MLRRGPHGWTIGGGMLVAFTLILLAVDGGADGPGGPWAIGGFLTGAGLVLMFLGIRGTLRERAQREPADAGDEPAGNAADAVEFTTALRGYDRATVDALAGQAQRALAGSSYLAREAARTAIATTELRVALRGYDCAEVDAYLAALSAALVSAEEAGDPAG